MTRRNRKQGVFSLRSDQTTSPLHSKQDKTRQDKTRQDDFIELSATLNALAGSTVCILLLLLCCVLLQAPAGAGWRGQGRRLDTQRPALARLG